MLINDYYRDGEFVSFEITNTTVYEYRMFSVSAELARIVSI